MRTTLIYLSLVSLSVMAKAQAQVPQADSISIPYKMLYTRTSERIGQLTDYIRFVSDHSQPPKKREYYSKRAIELFDQQRPTRVFVKHSDKTKMMSVENFFKRLATHPPKGFLCIDSICIPQFSHITPAMLRDSVNVICLPSEWVYVGVGPIAYHLPESLPLGRAGSSPIHMICNITEDGTEWVPKIGDLIITIQRENEEHEERNIHHDGLGRMPSVLNNSIRTGDEPSERF